MSILQKLPRFRDLDGQLQTLKMRESWSAEQIESWQLEKLNQLWNHAADSTTFYRSLANEHRIPARFDCLEEYFARMPILDKENVRENPNHFLSCQAVRGSWQRTGGSTGIPIRIFWQHDAHLEMLRAKYRGEQAFGRDVFDRKVFFWGHEGSIASGLAGWSERMRRPIEDRLRNRLRVSAYQLSDKHLLQAIKKIRRFEPQSIYGYASAIGLLADACKRHQITLPSLELAILTAEPVDPEMLQSCRDILQCDATVEYGSCECGLIAYQMPDGILRTRDDLSIVETVVNDIGEHEIIVTVLNNPSFPMLRYRIEDIAGGPWKREDHGFGYLSSIQGRSNDLLVTRSGKRLHSMALKHVLEKHPGIRRFSAHQSLAGDLTIRLESHQEISSDLVQTLRAEIESLLEGYPVAMVPVDQIAGNTAGKHRWIVSDLAASLNPSLPQSTQF